MPFLTPFFGWEGSPTIDYGKKATLILTSSLEDLVFIPQQLKALGSQPGPEVRFHRGFSRVPRLRGGASTKKSTACCWGYHLSLYIYIYILGPSARCPLLTPFLVGRVGSLHRIDQNEKNRRPFQPLWTVSWKWPARGLKAMPTPDSPPNTVQIPTFFSWRFGKATPKAKDESTPYSNSPCLKGYFRRNLGFHGIYRSLF